MKKITQVFIVGFAIVLSSCSNDASEKTLETETKLLETEIEQVSYIIAYDYAQSLKAQGLDSIDPLSVAKAYKDVYEGNESAISEEEVKGIMKAFSEKMRAKQAEKAEAGITKMNDWLSDTITTQEVQTTESGLQYQIIAEGNGVIPEINDKIKVHYYGFFADGEKFDSSLDRGEPIEFPLGQGRVIPGWDEAFQLMSVGSKWKLIIPSELGYGAQDNGLIPPNTDLLFIAELIAIN